LRRTERDDHRKRAISIRMSAADLEKIKKLAARLGTRDSDIVRFAVKSLLTRLAPLCDAETHGRSLVPVFVEAGSELLRYFELDASRLNSIVNDSAGDDLRVDYEDVQLLALSGLPPPYLRLKLSHLNGAGNGHDEQASGEAARTDERPDQVAQSLRRYLYEKYLFGETPGLRDRRQPGAA
jgi:hypothetical protein